ncbi:MAG TPA: acyl-CoA dehydrogenase family protein, partial [Vicinamibacterales bacterium]
MDFALSPHHEQRRLQGRALARDLGDAWTATQLVHQARAFGFPAPDADGVGDVLLLEALAAESASPAVVLALHTAVAQTVGIGRTGDHVAAVALTSEPVPTIVEGRLHGRAAWLAPVAPGGVAVVGARRGDVLTACLLALDAPGVSLHLVEPSGLRGLPCAHVDLDGASFEDLQAPQPIMAAARLLLAAVGLGIARRALREALRATTQYERTGPGGEQTLHGLVADVATELDAAMVVTWDAALE